MQSATGRTVRQKGREVKRAGWSYHVAMEFPQTVILERDASPKAGAER